MKIKSYIIPIVILVVLFGGIGVSKAADYWSTESKKVPVKYSEGEAKGSANPADIRGSYSFKDIRANFNIDVEILGKAFLIKDRDINEFKVKELETIFVEEKAKGTEVGTSSVRLFVAFYLNLPYEIVEESYLPLPGVEILKERGNLSDERVKYLDSHTIK